VKNHRAYLLCGATWLLACNVAYAAPAPSTASDSPKSYADLLEPIANAKEALLADDLARARRPKPLLQLAQLYRHHHHHHGYFGFGGGGIYVAPPVYAPDCYIQRRVYINPYDQRVIRNVEVCD
jgi:hypothetical protein